MAVTTGTTWDVILAARPAPVEHGTALSVRAAYQEALYERSLLVDLREDHERELGGIHPALAAATLPPRELLGHLINTTDLRPVVLISEDGRLAQETAETLAELDLAQVRYAVGGFEAWKQAGLPARS
ncbi:hypothetical protein LQF12_05635 [Ruania suaedae]|uniref:rhodanese-like domain-containing protein n=1 Tax=Ruania suaedae TaxID=2897774 RepID=UPI001E5DA29F|nr:rhodanese-like domain-containing protein [Ruania suaedae]UFU04071.1 hypothetical protein LQF12_05635 [Ruania suaedae]